MVSKAIGGHRVSFSDEELPCEGLMHNKALHITIKCWDKIVNRVLIDDDLAIIVGPANFIVEFQVMDITTSYNLLLRRPWIHMAGAVPSILHQLMSLCGTITK
ncbi:hypothetical protein R3W88_011534 [Solanum pinnatisectum]|uniref:DUF4283 domain-containing protein n=1 Tax=Solanum pinnatisectum TaxID=50273 RepID=A0AAV9L6G5_9SOLN|nr:hypothetical protein R3W88_011534 [Solanum pinnatisectum]